MATSRNTIRLFRNKYIIALTAFAVLMLFIDHNDIFQQLERRRQLNDLLASKAFYEKKIEQTKKNLADLQNNAAALEKYAREKYYLKRDNEDLFVIPAIENSQKNTKMNNN
ncbi:FtsB family cell division protein [Parafilimonas sp.]|uniref:FtsB family cell division protein n=1 Tax=Parafilimonas sp. TaxID=1969739 RepID=UPI0039E27F56